MKKGIITQRSIPSSLSQFVLKYTIIAFVVLILVMLAVAIRYNAIFKNYVETTSAHISTSIEIASLEDEAYLQNLLWRLRPYGVVSIHNLEKETKIQTTNMFAKNIIYSNDNIQIVFLKDYVLDVVHSEILKGTLLVGFICIFILLFNFLLDYLYIIKPLRKFQSEIITAFSTTNPTQLPLHRQDITNPLSSLLNSRIIPYIQSYKQNSRFISLLHKNLGVVKKTTDIVLNTSKEKQNFAFSKDLTLIRSCMQDLTAEHENLTNSRQIIETMYGTTKNFNSVRDQCDNLISELHTYVTDLQYLKNNLFPTFQNMQKTSTQDVNTVQSIKKKTTTLLTALIHHRNSLASIATFTNQVQLLAMNVSIEGSQSLPENNPIHVILTELQSMAKESNVKSQQSLSELQEYETHLNEISNSCNKLTATQSKFLDVFATLESIDHSYDKIMHNFNSIENQFKYMYDALMQVFENSNKNDEKLTTNHSMLYSNYENLRKSISSLEENIVVGSKNLKEQVHTLEDLSNKVSNTYEELRLLTTPYRNIQSFHSSEKNDSWIPSSKNEQVHIAETESLESE